MATNSGNLDIAIVGMAGRFPGARNLAEFWSNMVNGVESISWCSEQEVMDSGFHPEIARDPDFVPAAGKLEGEYMFDAGFFGFSPRDAQILDPQHRVLLECAWEALESAGYDPGSYAGRIGVYAGASANTYFPFHIAPNHQLLSSVGLLQAITANDKDFLASRIAYKLGLKGPAISVQTACSTSLVAVNLACQSLLNYQCDMVLAGGVSITPKGRLYKDGFIFSRDGHCRPFDEAANGAVFGNGAGLVVLKRLEDAIADRDSIYAVIKASAVNNDGSLKAGYTAPSVTGQMEVISEAHALGDIDPSTLGYIEAHGTGTSLGDPIEIAALIQAFPACKGDPWCAVGSVKGNIGHLEAAAGIAGLIKTALVLHHKKIPPTLHFQNANPRLNLEGSPFFVNAELRNWNSGDFPRRAAVSSFGFGGTNAHVVLEEAPAALPDSPGEDWHLMPVSAHTETSLQAAVCDLSGFFKNQPTANLADAAFTLQTGRKHFQKRGFAVVRTAGEAAEAFRTADSGRFMTGDSNESALPVTFMFPGQGSQAVNMALDIYRSEPLFRETIEECAATAARYLDRNLLDIIYPQDDRISECAELITRTEYAQPALFAIGYSLARLWQSWGVRPANMIGHSLGEYVAACIAGVFSLNDAIRIVCARGAAMQKQPYGEMMSVPMSEAELKPMLLDDISLAAVNAPNQCVVSGPAGSIAVLQDALAHRGIAARRLRVSHAFHSRMMEPAAEEFRSAFDGVTLLPPRIPFISNVTANWASASEVCTPEYWVNHLLAAVRFSEGWLRIARNGPTIFLEVGPDHTLAALSAHCSEDCNPGPGVEVLASCSREAGSARKQFLTSLGHLWMWGTSVDWSAMHHNKARRRIALPTYKFDRKLYWLPPVYLGHTKVADFGNTAITGSRSEISVETEAKQPAVNSHRELEDVVTSIWKETLGVEMIEPSDDFFVLGGHSLMAIQLIAEVRRRTGVNVLVKSFFQRPTISEMVAQIRDSRSSASADQRDQGIQPVPREGDLPLTFHQEEVWDFETTSPGTARYTGVIGLSLRGDLVRAGLEFSLNEILARHEVLRTTYSPGASGRPVAHIHPPEPLEIPFEDISHLESESRQRKILQSANRLVRRPFDLSRDVLVRALLFRTREAEHVLVFSSHYIAMDAWSVGLMIKELGEHYSAYIEGRPLNGPESNLQCIDYAYWQRSRLSEKSLEPHIAYWKQLLLDVKPQEPVPVDRPRPHHKSMGGSTFHFAFTPEASQSLKHFSHKHGSTLFFTLLSALNILFHLESGSDDIVIGTITGDRDLGMETIFGSFVNCLPLRTRLHVEHSFLELMENVRRTTTDAYTHQAPFHMIARAVSGNRDLSNDPLFRVSLVLRNISFTEVEAGKLKIEYLPLRTDRAVAEGDISVYLQEAGGALSGYFEYDHEIFEASTAERLAKTFVRLLEFFTANPEARLSDLTVALELPGKISELEAQELSPLAC